MGGRGASSGMGAYRRNVTRSEDTIRNEQTEHLLLLDKNGKIAMSTGDGQKSQVSVTPEMIAAARDAVMTHNHPGGTTFSWEDIHNALAMGLKEIRATTANNGTYSLRRDYDLNAQQPLRYRAFGYAYNEYVTNVLRPEVQSQIYAGKLTVSEAHERDNALRREWLRNNAKNYGWTYKEEKR